MSSISKAVCVAVSLEDREGLDGRRKVNHLAVKMLRKGTQSSAYISARRQPARREKFGKRTHFFVSQNVELL